MSQPVVRVNTFIQENVKLSIDSLSKMFIISELAFGINRIPVLKKLKSSYTFVGVLYCVILNAIVIYFDSQDRLFSKLDVTQIFYLIQFVFCCALALTTSNTLRNHYKELNEFDTEINYVVKINRESIENFIQMCLISVVIIFMYIIHIHNDLLPMISLYNIPLHVVHCFEVHFIGHLLGRLCPRLRLITDYIKSTIHKGSYNEPKTIDRINDFENKKHSHPIDTNKLLVFYHKIIKAYDYLNDAIKWQFLTIVVSSFITLLSIFYKLMLRFINGGITWGYGVTHIVWACIQIIMLFSPCIFSDRLHNEVITLREVLSCKLYKNRLDKASRSTVQALMALTEARNLSFSLLRMFDIDISFPFKFMALLVTYLIILLQFQKVLNLDTNSTN